MRRIFSHILCFGFLISLVNSGAARSIASRHSNYACRHANGQGAQDTDPKTQRPSSDRKWILTGKIGGKYALRMEVHRKGDQISGCYRYVNKPKAGYLVLRGAIDKYGFGEISEYNSGEKTGTFKGAFTGDIIGQNGPTDFVGAWTSANKPVSLEFSLSAEDAEKTSPADSTALKGRVDIKGKLHILRRDPRSPIPEDVSFSFGGSGCCYYKQPLITGKHPAQVLREIRKALDLETVFGDTIASLREDLYYKDDQGKRVPSHNEINIDYEVGYNENYILSFTYQRYDDFPRPRGFYYNRVFDLKTGKVVKAIDVFMRNSMQALARMVDLRFQKIMKDHLAEYRAENSDEEAYNQLKDLFAEQSFSPNFLDDFTVDGHGVTFYYNYGISPFYPIFDTEILAFSYEELKGYINPKGILGKFISK
jgi:hypothetical protein